MYYNDLNITDILFMKISNRAVFYQDPEKPVLYQDPERTAFHHGPAETVFYQDRSNRALTEQNIIYNPASRTSSNWQLFFFGNNKQTC